jgi:hypothetical protein
VIQVDVRGEQIGKRVPRIELIELTKTNLRELEVE